MLKKVGPIIEESVSAHELALLSEVRERGRWTVPTVLRDLHMGRLYVWWLPGDWRWRCRGGVVAWDQQAIEAFCPGQQTKQSELRDVLPELAAVHGGRLELVQDKAEETCRANSAGWQDFHDGKDDRASDCRQSSINKDFERCFSSLTHSSHRPASRTASTPVRNTPSKVPAPPIEATGAPRLATRPRLVRSAPMSVPSTPPT